MELHITARANHQACEITLSEDGYVRLTKGKLLSIPLVHLISGLDDDNPIFPKGGASLAYISGYTEWLSSTTPVITLGWDWKLDVVQGYPHYMRLDSPRSNIMLVDDMQRDLGNAKTLTLLETVVDGLAWQDKVHKQIADRYI